MKVYGAIGHFRGSENTTSIAFAQTTKKAFVRDLRGNGFVEYAVITESMLDRLLSLEGLELLEQVKKLVRNYRKWNDVCEYVEQCGDILLDKFEAAALAGERGNNAVERPTGHGGLR